ncbi:hypothetical protein BGY98DRAFT_991844, partial [Russula aff. rugulosa BPL654]
MIRLSIQLPIHRCITNMVAKLLSLYLLVVASLGVVQAAPLVLDQRQSQSQNTTPTGGPGTISESPNGGRRGFGGAVARGPAGTLTQE